MKTLGAISNSSFFTERCQEMKKYIYVFSLFLLLFEIKSDFFFFLTKHACLFKVQPHVVVQTKIVL